MSKRPSKAKAEAKSRDAAGEIIIVGPDGEEWAWDDAPQEARDAILSRFHGGLLQIMMKKYPEFREVCECIRDMTDEQRKSPEGRRLIEGAEGAVHDYFKGMGPRS